MPLCIKNPLDSTGRDHSLACEISSYWIWTFSRATLSRGEDKKNDIFWTLSRLPDYDGFGLRNGLIGNCKQSAPTDDVVVDGEPRVVHVVAAAAALGVVHHLEVVDRHLEDLCLLQLGAARLFQGGGHEPPQLAEGHVDPVAAPLLDDAAAPAAGGAAAAGDVGAARDAAGSVKR